jgi:hypothetical protein
MADSCAGTVGAIYQRRKLRSSESVKTCVHKTASGGIIASFPKESKKTPEEKGSLFLFSLLLPSPSFIMHINNVKNPTSTIIVRRIEKQSISAVP